MKALRFFTIVLVAVFVMSVWAPAPAYAKSSTAAVAMAKTKLARLRVNNRTGGSLTVRFSGERSYTFSTATQGKTTFQPVIEPGKYTITVTSSRCKGTLTYRRNVKGGTVNLPGFICH